MYIKRRSFLHLLGGLCVVAHQSDLFAMQRAINKPHPPNVIFILSDDLGYGDLGVTFQNNRKAAARLATPTLDRLADQGMLLTDHYAAAPVCAPSRASLITGKSQAICTLRNNQFDRPIERTLTLPMIFKAANYKTYALGKWGMAGGGESNQPIIAAPRQVGFDHSFVYMDHLDGHTYYHAEKDRPILEDDIVVPNSIQRFRYDTDLLTARAEKYIEDHCKSHPNKPFFIFLAYTTIHGSYNRANTQINGTPFHVPGRPFSPIQGQWPLPEEEQTKANTWLDPEFSKQNGFTTIPMQRYATTLKRLDDCLGDLMAFLKKHNLDNDKTMIVFTSDNGPAAENSANPKFFDSWGPFRGFKRWITEGGVRVPTIVHYPGTVPGGTISKSPSQSQCWMPTFAHLLQLEIPMHSDGRSILPTLIAPQLSANPQLIYSEYTNSAYGLGQQQMFREGDYVVVRQQIKSEADPVKLYNIAKDPKQQHDLLSGNPSAEMVALGKRLKHAMHNCRIPVAASLAACGTQGFTDGPRPYDNAPYYATKPIPQAVSWFATDKQPPWTPNFNFIAETSAFKPQSSRPQTPYVGLKMQGALHVDSTQPVTIQVTTSGSCHLVLHEARILQYEKPGTYAITLPLEKGNHPYQLHAVVPQAGKVSISLNQRTIHAI